MLLLESEIKVQLPNDIAKIDKQIKTLRAIISKDNSEDKKFMYKQLKNCNSIEINY